MSNAGNVASRRTGLCYVRNLDTAAQTVDLAIVRDGETMVARFTEAECYRLAEHMLSAARAMREAMAETLRDRELQ